ncbi:MAG: topoisomerase C-terminal repeat-containing protein, partial [Acidobacteriota bacterium]
GAGDRVETSDFEPTQHTTQPPARFTEASLVKELETRGIGRPSTYASIIQTIQDRGYVWHKGPALVPTFTAFAVTRLLEESLPDLVDYDFTARMENELDAIAGGQLDSTAWLGAFFLGHAGGNGSNTEIRELGLKALIAAHAEQIDPRVVSRFDLGKTEEGETIAVRVGRYGPYLQRGDSDQRASIPDDLAPDELTLDKALEMLDHAEKGDEALGNDPESDLPVYLKNGRFGWYVQLGDGGTDKKSKPKMASLWPSMDPQTLNLETALMLLSFPRTVGTHPDKGEAITAQDGRFGPYLKMGSETRSLENHEALASVTLEAAVDAFSKPKGGRGRGIQTLKELGTHPETNLELSIKSGRFGPYVTDGTVNASVPKGKDPEGVTLDDAVELIAKREAKIRAQGKDPRAPKAKKTRRKKKA